MLLINIFIARANHSRRSQIKIEDLVIAMTTIRLQVNHDYITSFLLNLQLYIFVFQKKKSEDYCVRQTKQCILTFTVSMKDKRNKTLLYCLFVFFCIFFVITTKISDVFFKIIQNIKWHFISDHLIPQ